MYISQPSPNDMVLNEKKKRISISANIILILISVDHALLHKKE